MNIQSLSERVPIYETIKAIEFLKNERNPEKLKEYLDAVMPFGEKATIKYRNKFLRRFIEVEGEEIIYSPMLKFINGIDSYQVKKEVIYFIVCATSDAVGEIVKAFYESHIPEQIAADKFTEIFTQAMPNSKESSIKKTFSIVTTILYDFNILNFKTDESSKTKVYVLNTNVRPTNEAILFNLHFEFLKLKGNKMPEEELILNCDTFKYFLMGDLMKKRYIKWMEDNKYLEHYVMGGNSKYQFAYDNIDLLVEKVTNND